MTCSSSMVLFLTDWKLMFETLSGQLKEFGLSLLGAVFVVLLGVEVWMGSGGRGDLSEGKVVSRNENELDSSMGVVLKRDEEKDGRPH